ncbi:MAG: radical SAM protein [Nitrospinota bacterium]
MRGYRLRQVVRPGCCRGCGRSSHLIAEALGACADCIRAKPEEVLPPIREFHAESRKAFGLPAEPPQAVGGAPCTLCVRQCHISEGALGYCGLRTSHDGKLVHLGGTRRDGILHWYYDPLPTNCVAGWVCAEGAHHGFKNLAVFYGACGFNCLFCQNWSYRELAQARTPKLTAEELADQVDAATACICFFGGDPSPQIGHAIAASQLALKKAGSRPLRICWETNGSMNPRVLRHAARLAMDSGGTVKFDLKAWDDNLHEALCGVSNRRTLENFRWLAEFGKQRREPPLAVASTLLVPGYVDAREVGEIARFIASIDPAIPYSLLGFHPHFFMTNLATTSRRHAEQCEKAAREASLANVHMGNRHLLSDAY